MRSMNPEMKLSEPVTKKDHAQGPKEETPLVLLEYGDYECLFCRQAYFIVKRLQKRLGNDLQFAFRNFPLSHIHPYAMNAARAAEAAGLQGKFWEMHDMLYENQESLDGESIISYALALDLDLEKFVEDMESREVEEHIVSDFYGGVQSGVNGTPSFFINGFRYDGDWSYDSFLYVLTNFRESFSGGESRPMNQ